MNIIERVKEAGAEHAIGTGISPNCIYLGHDEMKELMFWAEQNCYIKDAETEKKTGDTRPEVSGMKVFEVNAESHLAVGV